MPIYYSTSEKICKEVLHIPSENLLNEITEYGPSCQEIALENLIGMQKGAPLTWQEEQDIEEGQIDLKAMIDYGNEKYHLNLDYDHLFGPEDGDYR